MNDLRPGQRFALPREQGISIRFDGRDASRLAVVAITPQGQAIAFDQIGHGQWALQSLHGIGTQADIIAYITDDTQGGFASHAYPASLQIGSDHYTLPAPSEQLAAVIIGEIYTRDGSLRIKVSNEGYTFGIDAYVRARNFTSSRSRIGKDGAKGRRRRSGRISTMADLRAARSAPAAV
jgi:hypothetical protein